MPVEAYLVKKVCRNRTLVLDGHGADRAWKRALALDNFSFPWLDCAPPRTVFRGLWSDTRFYFLFTVSDSDLVLADGKDARQRVIDSDRIEIFLSTDPDLTTYYGLEVDPRGEVLDYRAHYHRKMDWDWTCTGLQVRASRNSHGYAVEGSIPLSILKELQCLHRDGNSQYLIAGLFRAEFSHSEDGKVVQNWIAWVNPQLPQVDFHVPSAFGILKLERL